MILPTPLLSSGQINQPTYSPASSALVSLNVS